MDPAALKKNFEEQIATTEKQIAELEENLTKAREYKIKLQGGLRLSDFWKETQTQTFQQKKHPLNKY